MLAFLGVTVPMALMNGFVAFLLWVYVTVLAPHVLVYGSMSGVRYTFLFALLALLSLVTGRLSDRGRLISNGIVVLLFVFMTHAVLSAIFALKPNYLIDYRLELFLKGMVLALVAPLFLTSRWRIHLLVVVLVLGLGLHATIDGLKVLASGGAHIIHGIPRSSLTDNNLYALGIVMLLPLILYLIKYSDLRLMRWGWMGCFVLCLVAIVGTNSRGAFLALVVLGMGYWVTSSRKFASAAVVIAASIVVVVLAPESWFDRIETIKNASEDESFLGRVAAWRVSAAIANGNPMFGGGFHAVQQTWIWDSYKTAASFISIDVPEGMSPKAAHSIYFQVLGDLGYMGLLVYLALFAAGFFYYLRIARLARSKSDSQRWISDLSAAIVLSLMAFMVGGAGVSMPYFELVFLYLMLLSVLYRMLFESSELLPQAVVKRYSGK